MKIRVGIQIISLCIGLPINALVFEANSLYSVSQERKHQINTQLFNEIMNGNVAINVKGRHGDTPLISAARYGDVGTAQQLLYKNPDLNATDDSGETALMLAARLPSVTLVNLLLEHGADPNQKDRGGKTALDYANMRMVNGVIARVPEVIDRLKAAMK